MLTPGNAGTLDMLNRGEIAMGPVWVDMFYTWQADGKMSPKVKLELPQPGLPGQPMYYVVPTKARQCGAREEVRRFRGEPGSAGRRHRQAVQLVSGHRPAIRPGEADDGGMEQALRRHLAGDAAKYGRPFPLSDYFTDILEGYERVVLK